MGVLFLEREVHVHVQKSWGFESFIELDQYALTPELLQQVWLGARALSMCGSVREMIPCCVGMWEQILQPCAQKLRCNVSERKWMLSILRMMRSMLQSWIAWLLHRSTSRPHLASPTPQHSARQLWRCVLTTFTVSSPAAGFAVTIAISCMISAI